MHGSHQGSKTRRQVYPPCKRQARTGIPPKDMERLKSWQERPLAVKVCRRKVPQVRTPRKTKPTLRVLDKHQLYYHDLFNGSESNKYSNACPSKSSHTSGAAFKSLSSSTQRPSTCQSCTNISENRIVTASPELNAAPKVNPTVLAKYNILASFHVFAKSRHVSLALLFSLVLLLFHQHQLHLLLLTLSAGRYRLRLGLSPFISLIQQLYTNSTLCLAIFPESRLPWTTTLPCSTAVCLGPMVIMSTRRKIMYVLSNLFNIADT